MSKPHTDGEKTSRMFGTLLIMVPSAHKGGAVSVKHRREKKSLSIPAGEHSYVCWYSGVSHEVRCITSGCRCVLAYNLSVGPSMPRPSFGIVQGPEIGIVRDALQEWLQATQKRCAVYYKLDHEYTEKNFSFEALKNNDMSRVQALKDLASELDMNIFLALLEKKTEGTCPDLYMGLKKLYPLNGARDIYHKIRDLVELDGRRVACGVHIDEEDIHIEPKEQDILSYESSRGATLMAWARNWEHWGEESQDVMDNVFKAALHWKDKEFFEHAADGTAWHPSPQFFQWARERVAAGDVPFNCFKRGFFNALMAIPMRDIRRKSIVLLVRPTEPILDDVRSWLHMVYNAVSSTNMGSSPNLNQYNGHELVDLISEYRDLDYLTTQSTALVKSKLQEFPFVLGFLAGLLQSSIVQTFSVIEIWKVYRNVGEKFIKALDISALKADDPGYTVEMRRILYSTRQYTKDPKLSIHNIRRIFTSILSAYIDIYVGRAPVKDTSLVRQPVDCDCHDCELLNDFLRDPVRRVFDLSVNCQREGHLARRLRHNRVDCRIAASFMGPSHTIIFAKTFEKKKEKARSDWMYRQDRAMRQLSEFCPETLTLMLGRNYTERIAEMMVSLERTTGSHTAGERPRRSLVETEARQQALLGPIARTPDFESDAGRTRGSGDATVGSGFLRETGANQRRPSSLGLGPGAGIKREAQDDAMSLGGFRTGLCPSSRGSGSIQGTHIKEEIESTLGSYKGGG
ncbi:hypothetical protein BJX96DRAFT_164901 [Aspergillus floccosus]